MQGRISKLELFILSLLRAYNFLDCEYWEEPTSFNLGLNSDSRSLKLFSFEHYFNAEAQSQLHLQFSNPFVHTTWVAMNRLSALE